jgi:hypothetical protein
MKATSTNFNPDNIRTNSQKYGLDLKKQVKKVVDITSKISRNHVMPRVNRILAMI